MKLPPDVSNTVSGKNATFYSIWPGSTLFASASVAHSDAQPTGDQEVVGLILAESSSILSWRFIMKYFLWSFHPFCWFKKGSCQFLAKECVQVEVNRLED